MTKDNLKISPPPDTPFEMTGNITDRFIDLLMDMRTRVNDVARIHASVALLDFLACAAEGCKHNRHIVSAFPTSEGLACMVIGDSTRRTMAELASYINAYNAHSTELDDGYKPGMTHIGAVVVSAVLAYAQEQNVTDYDTVLDAIVIGYEATARLSRSINPDHKRRGFHTTGTCGAIGAAVACAMLSGSGLKGVKTAISAAATSAAGLLEIQEQGSQLKPVNAANAASTAVTCGRLATLDIEAPDDAIGGPRGFVSLLAGNLDEAKLMRHANDFAISERYMKLYPACRHCHPAIEAALKASKNINPCDIKRIEVETYALAIKGHDHKSIRGIESAKLSIPFCVAFAASHGDFSQNLLQSCKLDNDQLYALIGNVEIKEGQGFTERQVTQRAATVRIAMADGLVTEATTLHAKGDPENPLSEEEFRHKFLSACEGTTLSPEIFDKLIIHIEH